MGQPMDDEQKDKRLDRKLKRLIDRHSNFIDVAELKLVEQGQENGFGGSVFLLLQNNFFSIEISESRDGIIYDIGPRNSSFENRYSFDIIWNHCRGNSVYLYPKKIDPIKFLESNIHKLEVMFGNTKENEVFVALRALERSRSKKLFG